MATCKHCGCDIPWGETKTKINVDGLGINLCPYCASLAGLNVGGRYVMNYQRYLWHIQSKKSFEDFNSKKDVLKLCDGKLLIHEPSGTFGVGSPWESNAKMVSF